MDGHHWKLCALIALSVENIKLFYILRFSLLICLHAEILVEDSNLFKCIDCNQMFGKSNGDTPDFLNVNGLVKQNI